ncbi:MAG: hypothetical protein H7829_01660 [Magnetococcus sp. THC-1_WYH]
MIDLIEITPELFPRLERFNTAFPNEERDASFWNRRFQHWWLDNPARSPGRPMGWALLDPAAGVVGFVANIALLFQWEGSLVPAATASTWRVLPAFRTQSFRLMMQLFRTEKQSILFGSTPNTTTAPLLVRSGFSPLPRVSTTRQMFILTADQAKHSIIINYLQKKKWTLPKTERPGFPNLHPILNFNQHPACSLFPVFEVGQEMDRFWEKTASLFANTFVRSAEAIHWYSFLNPYYRKQLIYILAKDRLIGYFLGKMSPKTNLTIFRIVDFWFDPDALAYIPTALANLVQLARCHHADMILFPTLPAPLSHAVAACQSVTVEDSTPLGFYRVEWDFSRKMVAADSYISDLHGDSEI